jgi:glycosyltransferase involved in cell wall biosynthesis
MIVHAYYPLGEIRVQREARALVDHGFEVDVICLKRPDEPAQDSEYGVQIYRLPVTRHKQHGALVQLLEYLAFFLLTLWQLFKLHLKRSYTTIQVHNLPDFLVFSALLPKLMGAKVLLDLHDLMPEFYAARFGTDLKALPVKIVELQEQLSCWFADHVITVTEAWRQTLISRGVPANKCSVVMNLPDPHVFPIEQNGATQSTAANGSIQLFYHGNVSHRYGLDNLVKAFHQVHHHVPQSRLTIHGRGEYQVELKKLIDELGLTQAVVLSTDLIPLEEVVLLIKSADLAVVPNRYDIFTDGILPTKLMEYAALGTPTIASKTTAIQNYFSQDMVHFVPPDNIPALTEAIMKLIGDKEQLKRLSTNIKKFNQLYNWPTEARHYIQLVQSLDDYKHINR